MKGLMKEVTEVVMEEDMEEDEEEARGVVAVEEDARAMEAGRAG